MKITKIFKVALCFVSGLCFLGGAKSALNAYAEAKSSDTVSENTVAAVVKLSSYYKVYEIEGLPENYEYSEVNEMPDFKGGKVIREIPFFMHIGTGVVVTKTGLILSNAHVTSAGKQPMIETKTNPQGNVVFGSDGNPIKYVEIPVSPNFMFVESVDISNLKKNDDAVCQCYLAKILVQDESYESQYRDRAILQITDKIAIMENGEPTIVPNGMKKVTFPFVSMDNPFAASFLDNKVKAIGFPSVGDPSRAAKTSGELLGYENASASKILHSSWISGGNSGGGLFYNDKLIGINTWDNHSNPVRPLAIAQPITWWSDFFIIAKWYYPEITLPSFSYDWANTDPSTDDYVNRAYIKFLVSYKSNPKEAVTKGQVLIYDSAWDIRDVIDYREYDRYFSQCWQIAQVLWNNSVKDTAEYFGITEEVAKNFCNITSLDELRKLMAEDVLAYYDIWKNGQFVYSLYSLENSGKVVITAGKNRKYELCYVDENGDVKDSYTLTCDNNTEQGPYTLWLY